MKYLKTYETFNEKELRDFLKKSEEKGEIVIKADIDKIVKPYIKYELGTFENFVSDEARFISEGDRNRMEKYIERFKEMGLDVNKLEELNTKYQKFRELHKQLDIIDFEGKDSVNRSSKEIWKEIETLEHIVPEFEKEVKKIAKEAKHLL